MAGFNPNINDVKFLSDDELKHELASPTGMVPGYIVMSELQDRAAMRSSMSGKKPSNLSMKDEMLQQMGHGYAQGGLVAQLNPFNTMAQIMQNPRLAGGYMQEQMNQMSGGLPALQPAQAPGELQPPPEMSSLIPTPSQAPQKPQQYSTGGLASLRR